MPGIERLSANLRNMARLNREEARMMHVINVSYISRDLLKDIMCGQKTASSRNILWEMILLLLNILKK